MVAKIIDWAKNNKLIAFILLFGALLRLLNITQESLWYDECLTGLAMKLPFMDMVKDRIAGGHSPLYFMILYPFTRIFGNNELMLRLPSAVASIASLYFFYLIAKKLFNDDSAIAISLAFFALSALNIYFSHEARMYSMCVLFVIISFYFLIRALDEDDAWLWVNYAAATVFAVYLSAITIPVFIAQAVYVLVKRRNLAGFFLSASAAMLLYVPMALFYAKMKTLGFIEWLPPVTVRTFIEFINGFSFKPVPLPNYPELFNAFMEYAGLLLALPLLIFAAVSSFKKRSKDREAALILLIWLLVPILLEYLYTVLKQPMLGPKRYVIVLSPAFYLLLGLGIKRLPKEIWKNIIAGFLIVLFTIALVTYYNAPTKEDWRGAISYIDSNLKAGDAFFGDKASVICYKYYGKDISMIILDIREMSSGMFGNGWLLLKEVDFRRIFGDDKFLVRNYKAVRVDKYFGLRIYRLGNNK